MENMINDLIKRNYIMTLSVRSAANDKYFDGRNEGAMILVEYLAIANKTQKDHDKFIYDIELLLFGEKLPE